MNQNRRSFLKTSLGGVAVLLSGCSAASSADGEDAEMALFVGTYTRGGSGGIYRLSMNPESGALRVLDSYGGVENPSFLAISPDNRFLFSVSETGSFMGATTGSVASFAIDATTGNLSKLSQQPSGGAAPAYVCVDSGARFVFVANYTGGNVAMLPVNESGVLAPPVSVRQHTGSSVHPQRQQRPHAHSIVLTPSERFAVAADLGTDRLMVYRIEATALVPADPPSYAVTPGDGPRHLAFHPNGRWAYVINELSSSITAYEFDGNAGSFSYIDTISTLPTGFSGQNTCAEVRVAPSGNFVYGSNRGHNSIAAFAVDEASGALGLVQHEPTGGSTPRNFEIDPTGRYVVAANQDSNNLVVLAIDAATGALSPTGETATVPVPVCVRFLSQS